MNPETLRSSKNTILIIEDEAALAEALGEHLVLSGFEVHYADGGEEGVNMAISTHPDLILLDLIMPGFSGTAVLYRLREDAWGATVPVIILTNLASASKAELTKRYGALDFLIKSQHSLEEITQKIIQVLQVAEDAAASRN